MPESDLGYLCKIEFDGMIYTVTDLKGNQEPETFQQVQVGHRVHLTPNPDPSDQNYYCAIGNRFITLTLPQGIADQIREGEYPTKVATPT